MVLIIVLCPLFIWNFLIGMYAYLHKKIKIGKTMMLSMLLLVFFTNIHTKKVSHFRKFSLNISRNVLQCIKKMSHNFYFFKVNSHITVILRWNTDSHQISEVKLRRTLSLKGQSGTEKGQRLEQEKMGNLGESWSPTSWNNMA